MNAPRYTDRSTDRSTEQVKRAGAPNRSTDPTDERTRRTYEESFSPTSETSSSVTRTRTYADLQHLIHILAHALEANHQDTITARRIEAHPDDPHLTAKRRATLNRAVKAAAKTRRHTRAVIEDVEWLVKAGEHPHNIARRLDTTQTALTRALHRAGRPDLARIIERKDAA